MRVLVYGAGGLGLYIAGRLAQAGHAVTVKGRAATVLALRGEPLQMWRDGAYVEVRDITVVDDMRAIRRPDLIILTTQAGQVRAAAQDLSTPLTEGSRVLTLQNGVDAPAELAELIGAERVLAGTIVVIAKRLSHSAVEVIGEEATMSLGVLPPGPATGVAAPSSQSQRVVDALRGAGIDASWTGNVLGALWKKLALIASYGGIGAVAGATVGETRGVPETRALVESAMREVFAVANAMGAALGKDDLGDILRTYERGFSPDTTASMQRDLAAGRPSELAYQNGAVVAHATRLGVDVPIHRVIYASQLVREQTARRVAKALRTGRV